MASSSSSSTTDLIKTEGNDDNKALLDFFEEAGTLTSKPEWDHEDLKKAYDSFKKLGDDVVLEFADAHALQKLLEDMEDLQSYNQEIEKMTRDLDKKNKEIHDEMQLHFLELRSWYDRVSKDIERVRMSDGTNARLRGRLGSKGERRCKEYLYRDNQGKQLKEPTLLGY